jgi:ubiquinone/menaquinone biosynthesis C-methylase UbiE
MAQEDVLAIMVTCAPSRPLPTTCPIISKSKGGGSMTENKFSGSVPETYHRYLVPLIFTDYARDLAQRIASRPVQAVLETAAGTGVLTECLVGQLPGEAHITATDFSPAMLAVAEANVSQADNLHLQEANGIDLPFDDDAFDSVVCQFGVMFFPDVVQGYREARRVLKDGGEFIFNVWDTLAANEIAQLLHETALSLDADNPPDFLKTPWSYNDIDAITAQLEQAGFSDVTVTVLPKECTAPSARDVALAFAAGSPLAMQLEERGLSDMAIERFIEVLEAQYGQGAVAGSMQAIVFQAR